MTMELSSGGTLLVRGGTVVASWGTAVADVRIEDGTITAIGRASEIWSRSCRVMRRLSK